MLIKRVMFYILFFRQLKFIRFFGQFCEIRFLFKYEQQVLILGRIEIIKCFVCYLFMVFIIVIRIILKNNMWYLIKQKVLEGRVYQFSEIRFSCELFRLGLFVNRFFFCFVYYSNLLQIIRVQLKVICLVLCGQYLVFFKIQLKMLKI